MQAIRIIFHIRLFTILFAAFVISYGWATPASLAAPELTDRAISYKIDDELHNDPGVPAAQIDVGTANGIVTLDGYSTNILAKERAALIARTVKGVRAVVNQIEVSPFQPRQDDAIGRDVATALKASPVAESHEIEARVEDAVVTLTGTVDSHSEKTLLDTIVKGVRGVTGVNDQLDVRMRKDRTDTEIKEEIEQAYAWNIFIDGGLIEIEVTEGHVTLSGVVGSAIEKARATAAAWVSGVEAVDDSQLTVAFWARDPRLRQDKYAKKPDPAIRRAVEDAIAADPRVVSRKINVHVARSIVTLRGEVGTLTAQLAAAQDARNTVGVFDVVNRLKVRPDKVPADSTIKKNVLAALQRDSYLERFDMDAKVINGTAHLYGAVDTRFEEQRAADVAADVTGVNYVKNHLVVGDERPYARDPYVDGQQADGRKSTQSPQESRRPANKTDADIKQAIEDELWWSPFVDSDRITVTVDNAVVTLSGSVQSWAEMHHAIENAYEGGAAVVDNDLTFAIE